MRKHCILLFAVVLLAATVAPAQTEGTVEVGGFDASTDGNTDVVGEYRPIDSGLALDVDVESDSAAFEAELNGDEDLVLSLEFDVNRSLRSLTEYTTLVHRLGFRNLDHFAAATNHGRVIQHTDLTPGQRYELDYTLLEHRTEFQPKGMDNLTFAVGYRQQERSGVRQQSNVSHCDTCHVINQSRAVDESTTDARLEAQIAWDGGQVTASIVNREYEDTAAATTLLYDNALHPELRAPVFDNRLQFDSAEGPQVVGQVPDIDKEIIEIDGSFDDVGGFALTAGGAWSTTENLYTGNEASYSGAVVSATKLFNNWNLSFRGRSYSLDNDNYFVDAVERLGVAGPQAGKTYRQIYGFDPDYLRRSALDRSVLETNFDLSRRLAGKKGTVRFSWDRMAIDRDNYEVAPGETETTTNVLGISWRTRPKKGWKTQLAFKHGETDKPFANVNGTFSPFTSGSSPNPFLPQAAQYYQFQDARIADESASPSSWDELTTRASHSAGSHTLSASYRFWDGDNDEGDLNDWGRSVQAATVAFWSAPAEDWQWHIAYNWNSTEMDLAASIPLFDG
jgi:hypothetical protein